MHIGSQSKSHLGSALAQPRPIALGIHRGGGWGHPGLTFSPLQAATKSGKGRGLLQPVPAAFTSNVCVTVDMNGGLRKRVPAMA